MPRAADSRTNRDHNRHRHHKQHTTKLTAPHPKAPQRLAVQALTVKLKEESRALVGSMCRVCCYSDSGRRVETSLAQSRHSEMSGSSKRRTRACLAHHNVHFHQFQRFPSFTLYDQFLVPTMPGRGARSDRRSGASRSLGRWRLNRLASCLARTASHQAPPSTELGFQMILPRLYERQPSSQTATCRPIAKQSASA